MDTPATAHNGASVPTVALGDRRRRPFGARFVTPLLMGATPNPINSSVIATAMVSIAAALGVSVGQTSILVSSLYLSSAIAQPTAGRLAEQFGPVGCFSPASSSSPSVEPWAAAGRTSPP